MTIHHGFIDGHHLSLFYRKVEELLKIKHKQGLAFSPLLHITDFKLRGNNYFP